MRNGANLIEIRMTIVDKGMWHNLPQETLMCYVAQAASFKAACVRLCGCRQCRMGCRRRAAALPGVGRHPARRCQQIVGTRIQLAATRERCFAGLARGDRRCMLVAARHVAVGVTSNGARIGMLWPRCVVSRAVALFLPPLGRFSRRWVDFRAVASFLAPLRPFSRRCVDFGGVVHNGAACAQHQEA